MIEIEKLSIDEGIKRDDHFISLYKQYLLGKRHAHVTRLPLKHINVGVRTRGKDGTFQWAFNELADDSVQRGIRSLRRGMRPTLHVYRGEGETFVCPDDAHSAEAYRLSGIGLVPCFILEDVPALPNGCLTIRTFYPLGQALTGVRSRRDVSSLPAKQLPGPDARTRVAELSDWAKETAIAVRGFHLEADEPVTHWHHVLISVAERVATATDAIGMLLERRAVLEAAAIVRLVYEMALTFHLNWLDPEYTGRYLQAIADVGPRGWKQAIEVLQSEPDAGINVSVRRAWAEGHERMGALCSSPNQKADLSPVGVLHAKIYPKLSGIAHQDFGALAAFAGRLDHADAAPATGLDETSLEHITNVSTTSILLRILDDVGLGSVDL
nr:hypothetical protein [uncultured Rhodopila sp.]